MIGCFYAARFGFELGWAPLRGDYGLKSQRLREASKFGFELDSHPLRGGSQIGFELDSYPLRGASKLGSFGFVSGLRDGRNRGDLERKGLRGKGLGVYFPD